MSGVRRLLPGLVLTAVVLTGCSDGASSSAAPSPDASSSGAASDSASVSASASTGETDHSGEQASEKSTAAALMAGALRHLGGLTTGELQGGPLKDDSGNRGFVAFATVDGAQQLVVSVIHGPQSTGIDLDCEKPPWSGRASLVCRRSTVDGRRVLTIGSTQDLVGADLGDNGVMWSSVARHADGDLVQVFLVLTPLQDGWLAGQNLPIDTDTMAAIATDPLLGLRTSAELIAEGDALDFTDQQLR